MARLGDFPQAERYERIRRIGAGATGVVYEALDRERGRPVALKALRAPPFGDQILHFKNEFRGLRDVRHDNLVRLFDLCQEENQWFFTMELIDGVDFVEHVRPSSAPWAETNSWLSFAPTLVAGDSKAIQRYPDSTRDEAGPANDEANYELLRAALQQLADGLTALHRAQRAHRDIKPSNVLVTRDGRVVLVDFGMAVDLRQPQRRELAGTPCYMAPEQVERGTVGPEADWYSVGAVLFEALTNEPPYTGSAAQILTDKMELEPPTPRDFVPAVPDDLDDLCRTLMSRNSAARPQGLDVLRRLGAGSAAELRSNATTADELTFVGRNAELATLEGALADTDADTDTERRDCVIQLVHGESGVGKSELLRRFGASVNPTAIVLAGRCYEHESLACKAFDGIIDALSEVLANMSLAEQSTIVPDDAALLLDAFPVLKRVEALCRAPRVDLESVHATRRRARAFAALRTLLAVLCKQRQIVLIIDDLQWADDESIDLLTKLTARPAPPRLLILLASRSESPQDTTARLDDVAKQADLRILELTPLPRTAAVQLASQWLSAIGGSASTTVAQGIAKETGGHPLFIAELARYRSLIRDGEVRLDDALRGRIERLSPSAHAVLEVLAVSKRPLPQSAVGRAAEIPAPELSELIDFLRDQHLARIDGSRRSDLVEIYHDRVRKVVASACAARHQTIHHKIALALEGAAEIETELLAHHWLGAGDQRRAAAFASLAADQASMELAFDRAARLYHMALELADEDDPRRGALLERLGNAYAGAGRGRDAADAYTQAAHLCEDAKAIALQQQAAEQLLRSGYIDEGVSAMSPVLAAHALRMPATPSQALRGFLSGSLKLRFKRQRPKRLREHPAPSPELARIDACWAAAIGLFTVDQMRGLYFHVNHLELALASADPFRIARGLAMEATALAARGANPERIEQLLHRARALARADGAPFLDGLLELAAGVVAGMQGRWRSCHSLCTDAIDLLRHKCTGISWEIGCAELSMGWAQCHLGNLSTLASEVKRRVAEARERSDHYALTGACSGFPNVIWLMEDDPEQARRMATDAITGWSQEGFHLQHMLDLFAQTQIDLYTGDTATAFCRLGGAWPRLERSHLLQVELNRVLMGELRARAALAAARTESPPRRRELWAIARKEARRLRRTKRPWARALALLIDAQLAAQANHDNEARALLDSAIVALEQNDMRLYAQAAQSRRDQLRPAGLVQTGPAGERLFSNQGVVRPDRFTGLFTPGFRDP